MSSIKFLIIYLLMQLSLNLKTQMLFSSHHTSLPNHPFTKKRKYLILLTSIKIFPRRYIYLFGDLNARCATPNYNQYKYIPNPDQVINSYGRKIINLCKNSRMILINGLLYRNRRMDSDFTFFRGSLKSQNDWCATNNTQSIQSFCIYQS